MTYRVELRELATGELTEQLGCFDDLAEALRIAGAAALELAAGADQCFDFVGEDEEQDMRRSVDELRRYFKRFCTH